MTIVTRRNNRSLDARMFEPFFRFPYLEEASTAQSWNPAVDVVEENDRIGVKIEVPGVSENDLKVTFDDGLLTISGERPFERKEDRNYHRIERQYGSFVRQFTLPRTVDGNAITASYRNGVLEIEIPKRQEAQPKQIVINVNA